jgi:ABC-type transport system involved in multi-copper enzyme maturation permease subunit
VIVIGTSRLLSMLTVGDEEKIVKDVGLSAISVFGVLTAGFVGVSLVFKEIERRTVYTLLAQPVRRWQFVAGKFVGLLFVLGMQVGLMSAALFALLVYRGERSLPLLPALGLILVELAVVTAFALLFSTVTRPILAAVSTLSVWVMGHLSWSLRLLEDELPAGPQRLLVEAFYWIVPHLDRLDVKSEVVHGVPLGATFLATAVGYGVAYAAVVLVIACLAFERRDFS